MWHIDEILAKIQAKLEGRSTSAELTQKHIAYHRAVLTKLSSRFMANYGKATFLGMGGSGIVIKLSAASDTNVPMTEKCIKYPQPMVGTEGTFSLAQVLDNEAKTLSSVHHQNILPIDEFGELNLEGSPGVETRDNKVPFYVMPFIDSVDLAQYVESPTATASKLVKLLHQSSQALQYLHESGFVHLDIKPGNIFVQDPTSEKPKALLADFGFCKRINTQSETRTLVMGTEEYIHPDLRELMQSRTVSNALRTRDMISRNQLDPRFDRYSFGLTIVNAAQGFLDHFERDNQRTIPIGVYRGLLLTALRCSDGKPQSFRSNRLREKLLPQRLFQPDIAELLKYKDTEGLAHNLGILSSTFRDIRFEEEIEDSTRALVCIPPRTLAPFSARVRKALDSTPIRRLASVAQLALCYHVYPGASHSRKEHVIGVFQTTARLLRYILLDSKNPVGAFFLNEKNQRIALLAAIFHDIAHFPLMHELEDSIPDLKQEKYTAEILQRKWGGSEFQQELDRVLELWNVTRLDLILALSTDASATKPSSMPEAEWAKLWRQPEFELLRSLQDGAIDADKIDYLQRDALHAGVQFGHGVDIERLSRKMTAALFVAGTGAGERITCRLSAWNKAQAAAESVISVRHSMHSQVYAHRTTRASRSMLNYIVWHWCASGDIPEAQVADYVFAAGSQLQGFPADLFQGDKVERLESIKNIQATIKDNLPYFEARLIRWLASLSGRAEVKQMAEALVTRNLYKEVCCLTENEVSTFLTISFPKRGREKSRGSSGLDAKGWIQVVECMCMRLRSYLMAENEQITTPISLPERGELPLALIDVSIPKTMRSQKELVIVADSAGEDVSKKRVEELVSSSGLTLLPGLSVQTSAIYETFGGRSGNDAIGKAQVRIFCRSEFSAPVRTHIDKGKFIEWLNSWRPDNAEE